MVFMVCQHCKSIYHSTKNHSQAKFDKEWEWLDGNKIAPWKKPEHNCSEHEAAAQEK